MATIIRIGDKYVNLDNVLSISFISDSEVCVKLIDGTPQYITCYYTEEVKEILDALADRTKKGV
jgi:hypothetical protein